MRFDRFDDRCFVRVLDTLDLDDWLVARDGADRDGIRAWPCLLSCDLGLFG